MIFYIIAGIFSALAILFLLAKFDFKKVLWLDIPIDIASTVLWSPCLLHVCSMMAAVMGVLISVTLYTVKKLKGYKPIRKGLRVNGLTRDNTEVLTVSCSKVVGSATEGRVTDTLTTST